MDKVMLKKGKKKQAKDELDRQKQAEKKRRRLEKALATSAAIRSELEKKKQKKIEEQQRLDEEGAAIAEAVALHVLVGEDTEESHRYNPWEHCGNVGLFMGYQNFTKYSVEGAGWPTGAKWNDWGIGQSQETEISAGLMASLQIAEDSGPRAAATFVISNMSDAIDFYKEL